MLEVIKQLLIKIITSTITILLLTNLSPIAKAAATTAAAASANKRYQYRRQIVNI